MFLKYFIRHPGDLCRNMYFVVIYDFTNTKNCMVII